MDGAHAQESRGFQAIDLHWHDLRHEYASRLADREALQHPAARLERGHRFTFILQSPEPAYRSPAEIAGTKQRKLLKLKRVSELAALPGHVSNSMCGT